MKGRDRVRQPNRRTRAAGLPIARAVARSGGRELSNSRAFYQNRHSGPGIKRSSQGAEILYVSRALMSPIAH